MDTQARHALAIIRRCVASERFSLARHFQERMDLRGFLWADVLAMLDDPQDVRDGGPEQLGRPKWIIGGTTADGQSIDAVCVLDHDAAGEWTVFITLY